MDTSGIMSHQKVSTKLTDGKAKKATLAICIAVDAQMATSSDLRAMSIQSNCIFLL
jgi:hypothetical protein